MRFKEIQGKPGKPERTGSDRFRNRKPEKTETGKTEPDQEVRFSYDSVKPWSTMVIVRDNGRGSGHANGSDIVAVVVFICSGNAVVMVI